MPIPDEVPINVSSGGLAAVLLFMLEKGFSREKFGFPAGAWEPKDYRTDSSTCFGVSYNTLRKMLRNDEVAESSVRKVANRLTSALADDHAVKAMWVECATTQPQIKRKNLANVTKDATAKVASGTIVMDGLWVYILRRHNAEKFALAEAADYITGIFQWQNYSISTAYNYGYLVEKDRLVRHRNWTASDCGVGAKSAFIPYHSEYYNPVTNEAGVSGLIYAKYDGLQTASTGRMALRGYYYDTDTGSAKDGGEFYAERINQSADGSIEMSSEIAEKLSKSL